MAQPMIDICVSDALDTVIFESPSVSSICVLHPPICPQQSPGFGGNPFFFGFLFLPFFFKFDTIVVLLPSEQGVRIEPLLVRIAV